MCDGWGGKLVMGYEREPLIRVGLMTNATEARIHLSEGYITNTGELLGAGEYVARFDNGMVSLTGDGSDFQMKAVETVCLSPADFNGCRITVEDVTIGIGFHWQRKEAQQFKGALLIKATNSGLTVINELPLEAYRVSVISSERSAACPPELLRAHAAA